MKIGLIGKNLSYSLSKELHTIFLEDNNIEGEYKNIEVEEKDIYKFFRDDIKKIRGINVTIPYKNEVMKYIDEVSKESEILNSVNTIINENGKLRGENTDIIGFELMVKRKKINFKNKTVVILGTGATSQMVKYYSEKEKAKKIILVSRNKKEGCITYDEIKEGDILINTTPVGTKDVKSILLIDEKHIKIFETIIEVTYNPFRTKLLTYGIYNNKKVVNGLYMLVSQGIKSEEMFINKKISEEIIENIYKKMLSKVNIVLIGMSGSGKSTIGEELGKRLNRKHVDIDLEIIKSSGKEIREIFNESEEKFRNLESMKIEEMSEKDNLIISVGGGGIKRKENMENLYKNGVIIYINRDVDEIIKSLEHTNTRPLLDGDIKNNIRKLFKEREDDYKKYSEIEVSNKKIEEVVESIIMKVGEL